jgi:hypothetical protein
MVSKLFMFENTTFDTHNVRYPYLQIGCHCHININLKTHVPFYFVNSKTHVPFYFVAMYVPVRARDEM